MATAKDRQSLAVWEEFHKSLLRGVEVDNSLTRQDIERQRAQLERDPIEWIKFFFPAYAKYEFAPFHIRAIRRVIANDEWYEVLSWSRELAKSTVAMFILMFLTLTRRKRFVALASATIDSAKRLLLPFKINFESNPRIRQFYGEQTTIWQWTDSEFSCRCGAKFIALGAGSAPRGMRNEAIRPDILYFDETQSRSTRNGTGRSTRFILHVPSLNQRWFFGVATSSQRTAASHAQDISLTHGTLSTYAMPQDAPHGRRRTRRSK